MKSHLELTDDEFVAEFVACKFPPDLFTHEAHLRLAWISVGKYGVEMAVAKVCSQLKKYVLHAGAANKYNHTLTVAAVRAVNHFMQRNPSTTFSAFIISAVKLKTNFRELILSHYSLDVFKSEQAKQAYLEPDLCPF